MNITALKHFVTVAALLVPAAALAQANNFDLVVDGKQMGKDTYTLKPSKQGFNLESRFTFKLPTPEGPTPLIDLTHEAKLTPNYTYIDGLVTDHNNYAHHISYTPNKSGTEMTIANYSSEHPITQNIPAKPNFLMMMPLDPATAQAALLGILAHPSPNDIYDIFLADPSGAGGGGGGRRGGGGGSPAAAGPGEPSNDFYSAKWFKGKDSGGMLDGKPVLLHTYLLAYGQSRYIFYADESNTLMVLNAPALKASYIRSKFKLNQTAPPAATAPAKP